MSQKNKGDLSSEINANLPDNNIGIITPGALRGVVSDMLDSLAPDSNVLPSATLPLSGSEIVSVKQGGIDKQTPASSLIGASTATPGGTSGQVQINNAGAFGGVTISGDAALNSSTGALSVTKTGGVSFGVLATLAPTGVAGSTTYLRGDGSWSSIPGGLNIHTVTSSPFTVSAPQNVILCNVSGALTVNLPASFSSSVSITIKDISGLASTNNITVVPNGPETIDGASSDTIASNYGARTYLPTGTGWAII